MARGSCFHGWLLRRQVAARGCRESESFMYNQLFQLASLLVMPFWFLMIVLPFWRPARQIVASSWIVLPAALFYALLVLPNLGELFQLLLNPALAPIAALLGTPFGATVAWVHFLAFDLFVGRWIFLDSRRRGISAWLTSPLLLLTLLFGPFGLLLYLLLRAFLGNRRIETVIEQQLPSNR